MTKEPLATNKIIGSRKAAFRKFSAEAPASISMLSLNQVKAEPIIHHSDLSGELRKKLLKSIEEAKTSIECLTFSFSDREILDLLLKKANEGVKVTVVADRDHMNMLCPFNNKITLLTRPAGEGRLHHKIVAIDEKAVWIGSANFSPNSLLKQNNTMIYLESQELAKAIHEDTQYFLGLCPRSATPLPPIQIEGQTIELLLFPHVPFGVNQSPEKTLNDLGIPKCTQNLADRRVQSCRPNFESPIDLLYNNQMADKY